MRIMPLNEPQCLIRIYLQEIQFQFGISNNIIGTGIPKSQPNINTFFFPIYQMGWRQRDFKQS